MEDTRYEARFEPEAWVNGQAIPVDAHGPQRWDCTDYARQHAAYLADVARRRSESLDDPDGVLDNDDLFKADPAAPAWVREWRGPFTIRVTTGEWWTTEERLAHERHGFAEAAAGCRLCAREARTGHTTGA